MPLVISQAVGEHLGVGLLAPGAVVKTHLAALAAALQLQEPADGKAPAVTIPGAADFDGVRGSFQSSWLFFSLDCNDIICQTS